MAITYLKRSPGIAPVDISETTATVAQMLARLESEGEAATRAYSARLDSWEPESFVVGHDVIAQAKQNLSTTTIDDIEFAHRQVRTFADRHARA